MINKRRIADEFIIFCRVGTNGWSPHLFINYFTKQIGLYYIYSDNRKKVQWIRNYKDAKTRIVFLKTHNPKSKYIKYYIAAIKAIDAM